MAFILFLMVLSRSCLVFRVAHRILPKKWKRNIAISMNGMQGFMNKPKAQRKVKGMNVRFRHYSIFNSCPVKCQTMLEIILLNPK